MMDLQSLMDSMSLDPNHPNDGSQQQIENLADLIQERLGIDLGKDQFRDLAAKLVQMNLEKRQTEVHADHKDTAPQQSASDGNTASSSTWHSPGHEHNPSAPRTNLQTLFHGPPAAPRGRPREPRERQNSTPTNRSSTTSLLNFFGGGSKPAAAVQPTTIPPTRTRSRSPFRMFARSSNSDSGSKLNVDAADDEKKEHDVSLPTAESARVPIRGVGRLHSGRESSMLDPSADKPVVVKRRADSPVPLRSQQSASVSTGFPVHPASLDSPPRHSSATTNRPLSPYARPGLQDDDGGDNYMQTKSPKRRVVANEAAQEVKGHVRSQSFDSDVISASTTTELPMHSSATTRQNFGAEQEDESVQQPQAPPGHRKSLSEPMHLGDIDFDQVDLANLSLGGGGDTPDWPMPAFGDFEQQVFGDSQLSPAPLAPKFASPPAPLQFRTPKVADVAEDVNVFKTAAGKNRRKGGTPPFFAQSKFFPTTSSSSASSQHSFSPASLDSVPGVAVATFPKPSTFIDVNDNHLPLFTMGAPKAKGKATSKRTFRHPSQQATMKEVVLAPSPPSPMDIDPVTPPPLKPSRAAPVSTSTTEFHMGSSTARKHVIPVRPRANNHPWQQDAKSHLADKEHIRDPTLHESSLNPMPPQYAPFRQATEPAKALPPTKEEKRAELVTTLREEARELYQSQDFKGSIARWTSAIQLFEDVGSHATNDTLAVLLSNRAACFVMIDACEAAVRDCLEALPHVSDTAGEGSPFSHDCGLPLRVKLLLRVGKAYLKSGHHQASIQKLDKAIEDATQAIKLASMVLPPAQVESSKALLSQMVTEATLTKSEAQRLANLCDLINACMPSTKGGNIGANERRAYVEALGRVNIALTIAGGSVSLLESKATLLTAMHRWRETASFLERVACARVSWDGVFSCDGLSLHDPLPGVPRAKFLSAFSFDNTDETDEEAEVKLNSKACGEAVLRLPYSLAQTYVRALRLEERYPSVEAALKSLEDLAERGDHVHCSSLLKSKFSWLSREYTKLNRTKKGRELGDELFRMQDFELAAKEYGKCLAIDGDEPGALGVGAAGGRLHAVLYCNRAACFMPLRRFTDALDECAAALRIHPRYMKALLRRARCYSRLNRYEEAIREYEKWQQFAAEGKRSPKSSSGSSPCWFDLPRDVTGADADMVRKELDEVRKSKRRMDAAAREAANRQNERQQWQDNMHSRSFGGTGSRPNSDAEQRREDWYDQQNDSRRWDSFSGRYPRSGGPNSSGPSNSSSAHPGPGRSRTWDHTAGTGRSNSAHSRQTVGSPGSDLSVSHYDVLGVTRHASTRDIKKAYRAKALTEHPDKNINDPHAADKFRRIQLAYEVLSESLTRHTYDVEQGFGRR